MRLYLPLTLYILSFFASSSALAQNTTSEPLANVLRRVEDRFGVEIRCKRFTADSVSVRYADFRIRPYSLAESLDNLLHPLDLVWSGERQITVQPYEYYRRTPADGERLLSWLASQYNDVASWESRRATLLREAREALSLDRFMRGLQPHPNIKLSEPMNHDGYTTQNYALETLAGLYVCGTIYSRREASIRGQRMVGVGRRPRNPQRPLVIAPSGHWEGGRYRDDHQLLMATLARMGAVAVDMDIVGWGDSETQIGLDAHTTQYSMQLQALWSKAVLDWVVASRRDIDTTRIAATGGSGGATHALLLALLDPRVKTLAPVAHLVSHFDGGCACESGRPVTLAAGGTCTTELLAAVAAPHPLLVVSDGGDWTASYPTLEYPFLKRIWGFYGADNQVENHHLADERHDFGASKRRAVYDFLARTLRLNLPLADEQRVTLQPAEALRSFAEGTPLGAIASREQLETLIQTLR